MLQPCNHHGHSVTRYWGRVECIADVQSGILHTLWTGFMDKHTVESAGDPSTPSLCGICLPADRSKLRSEML